MNKEKDMDKKCNKYEGLFTFGTEEDFLKHLSECENCQKEHEKALKLSSLIKESANEYRRLEKKSSLKKTMCKIACTLVVVSSLGIYAGIEINENHRYQSFINSETETSIIAQEGLPVDDMGFFKYN